MKIFVSYSRRDAGDFAEHIQNHFSNFKEYDIFTDVSKIKIGDFWSNTIENNIASCDIFLVIVTYGSLQSPNVENEILQAQRENKKIIPCFYKNIKDSDIKWGLNTIQGITFEDKYELVRNLQYKLKQANISTDPPSSSTKRHIPKEPSATFNPYNNHEQQTNTNYISVKGKKGFSKIVIGGIAGAIVIIVVIAVVMFAGSHDQLIPVYQQPSLSSITTNNTKVSGSPIYTTMNQPVNIQLHSPYDDAIIVSNPIHGILGAINQATGTVTYTPNPGFTGSDEFKFQVIGKAFTNVTTVSIIVSGQ